MSAFISLKMKGGIEILSDTLVTDRAGIMLGLAAKTLALPGMRAAVTFRGETDPLRDFTMAYLLPNMAGEADFDVAIDKLRLRLLRPSQPVALLEAGIILISGWGARGGFRNFILATGENHWGLNPMMLQECGSLTVSGTVGEDEIEGAGLSFDSLDRGLEDAGHRFFQIFRQPTEMPHNPSTSATTVGGQLVLTTITRTGVEQHVIGFWSDLIGQQADPKRRFVPVF